MSSTTLGNYISLLFLNTTPLAYNTFVCALETWFPFQYKLYKVWLRKSSLEWTQHAVYGSFSRHKAENKVTNLRHEPLTDWNWQTTIAHCEQTSNDFWKREHKHQAMWDVKLQSKHNILAIIVASTWSILSSGIGNHSCLNGKSLTPIRLLPKNNMLTWAFGMGLSCVCNVSISTCVMKLKQFKWDWSCYLKKGKGKSINSYLSHHFWVCQRHGTLLSFCC